MRYIVSEKIKTDDYSIDNYIFKYSWNLPRKVKVNNSEYYNVLGITIDPRHRDIIFTMYPKQNDIHIMVEFVGINIEIFEEKEFLCICT